MGTGQTDSQTTGEMQIESLFRTWGEKAPHSEGEGVLRKKERGINPGKN